MKVMAYERIPVVTAQGLSDNRSYIAARDLCILEEKTPSGLYPVTYPTAKGKKTRYLKSLKGFLVNQNHFAGLPYTAPGYPKATIKSSGCGVCAAVMVVGALQGKHLPVRAMRDLALSCGARVSGGTDMKLLTAELCRRYDLRCQLSNDVQALENHLKAGGVAICNTAGRGMFSTGGHYVVALGLLDECVCIADPGLYDGKYNTPRRRKVVTVEGELLLAHKSVLDDDCVGRWPRYYLLEAVKK